MLPLLDASVPANAGMVFGELARIAAFDYYDISTFTDHWLKIVPTKPVNAKLEMVGFISKQFIANVGTFTIFIVIYATLVGFYLITLPLNGCP